MSLATVSPLGLLRTLWQRRQLLLQLARRDAFGRYKHSVFGVLWTLLTPILILAVYTFVFSEVFKASWGPRPQGSKLEFAVILFAGLSVFNLFAETVNRAPMLIVSNATLVKKVVFPLDILPVVSLLSALVPFILAVAVLLAFESVVFGRIPLTALLLPVVIAPLALLVLGVSWFLSALGVYVRDVAQTVSIVVTALLFLSPVFFPASALPGEWRFLLAFNPLAVPIEQARGVLIWGEIPEWSIWFTNLGVAVAIAWLGYAWFQLTRKGFADVL